MCCPLWPIGDNAGPVEVVLARPRNPLGSPLDYFGGRGEGEKVADFPFFLSHI